MTQDNKNTDLLSADGQKLLCKQHYMHTVSHSLTHPLILSLSLSRTQIARWLVCE